MAVPIETIQPGAVFRFKTAQRRVVAIFDVTARGCMVRWAYADQKPRGGKLGGEQWVHYFRTDAIEQVPNDGDAKAFRVLRPSRVRAPFLSEAVEIKIVTQCPAKWAMVDLETGEAWSHDGRVLKRMSDPERADVAAAVAQAPATGLDISP